MNEDINEKKRRNHLFELFEHIKSTGGTLVIGGDFFDFWFTYKLVIPSGYTNLIEKLEQLNLSGISIHYVLGNHDYWDLGYFKEKFGAHVYNTEMEFIHAKLKIQVAHGDGLLKNDYGYRFMRKIIRSKPFIFLFKNFHPDWGCKIAKSISNTSEKYHHHDNKSTEIKNELLNYARGQWSLGYSTIMIGHYHQTGIIKENNNYLIFLGDWLRHFTVTRLDNDGWWQGSWEKK